MKSTWVGARSGLESGLGVLGSRRRRAGAAVGRRGVGLGYLLADGLCLDCGIGFRDALEAFDREKFVVGGDDDGLDAAVEVEKGLFREWLAGGQILQWGDARECVAPANQEVAAADVPEILAGVVKSPLRCGRARGLTGVPKGQL